jgi:hypothetical protein
MENLHSLTNQMDYFLCGGLYPGGAQVRQESVVGARERAAAENDSADRACSFVVSDSHKVAVRVLFDGHFWNNRNPHAGPNHAEDAAELAALEDDLWIDSRPVACGNGGVTEAMAVPKKQEWFLVEILQRNGAPIRECMLGRERGEQPFGEERKGVELVAAYGQRQQGDIHSTGAEALQKYGSDFFHHSDLDLGELPREQGEMRRKEIGRDGGNDADRERTADGNLALPDVALGGLEFAEDGAGARKKCRPEIGEADGAAEAVKQSGAEFGFEFEDLLGKRWLGNVRLLGRAAEGPGFSHGAEVAELVQFHSVTFTLNFQATAIGRAYP